MKILLKEVENVKNQLKGERRKPPSKGKGKQSYQKTPHQHNLKQVKSQSFGEILRYRWVPKVRPLDNP